MGRPKSGATPRGRPGTSGGKSGESAALEALRRRLPGPPPGEVWIGDDAAVLGPAPGVLLLTTDMAVGGVHADLTLMSLADLGWRATAGALSDIAAMGGRAAHAVVAVAGPPSTDLDQLYDGIAACAAAHRCPVVGGDLSTGAEIVVAVTVTGRVPGGPGPVLRRGARPGDRLFVTGPLGGAAAGLAALRAGRRAEPGTERLVEALCRPRARLAEGEAARRAGATAMVDISDGLATDLGHLAEASGVGFRLDAVPVADGATLDDALGGGEDYELVLAAPDPDRLVAAFGRAGLRSPIPLGRCVDDRAERTLAGDPVPALGWEHPWGSSP